MADSVARQVERFLKKNPTISNADLYKAFPMVRENTLRNYKSKFKKAVLDNGSTEGGQPSIFSSTQPGFRASEPSLRSRVFDFFNNNPKADNETLYREFSEFSKNKLRHYKASFFKTISATPAKSTQMRQAISKRLTSASKTTRKTPTIKDLEERIDKLEKQVKQLIAASSNIELVKTTISSKTGGVEKRIKELEENLLSFISNKRKKVKDEISNLDDLQQLVTNKINAFMAGMKVKK